MNNPAQSWWTGPNIVRLTAVLLMLYGASPWILWIFLAMYKYFGSGGQDPIAVGMLGPLVFGLLFYLVFGSYQLFRAGYLLWNSKFAGVRIGRVAALWMSPFGLFLIFIALDSLFDRYTFTFQSLAELWDIVILFTYILYYTLLIYGLITSGKILQNTSEST